MSERGLTATPKKKTWFFGQTIHPEQAFGQDNAKSALCLALKSLRSSHVKTANHYWTMRSYSVDGDWGWFGVC